MNAKRKMKISLLKTRTQKYKKLQISKLKVSFIREELELGQSDWTNDAWKTFIYLFKKKLENIKTQFDQEDDYKYITYSISITLY